MLRTSHARLPRLTPALLLATLAGGCSSGNSSNDSNVFKIRNTGQAVAANNPVVTSDRWLAFLAEEAETGDGMGGTSSFLNLDGDVLDSVVTVVNMLSRTETNVAIAAEDITWAGTDLYIAVNEANDTVDWDDDLDVGMLTTEISLVHWSSAAGTATFVASLDAACAMPMIAVGELLFFSEEVAMAPGMSMTNLRVIDTSVDPLVATPVTTQSSATNGLQPRLMGQDEGLVFVYMDETVDVEDLNEDGDMTDGFVFALLDGTIATGEVMNTKLGLANAAVPVRAKSTAPNDWLVAFLVSEAAQLPLDNLGLNNYLDPQFVAGWIPNQCFGAPDQDTADNVLHYIHLDAWAMDPVLNPIRNTGLTGRTRVVVVDDYVGTISREGDEVLDGGCDLNMDLDVVDRIVRWTRAVGGTPATDPILPPSHPDNHLLALGSVLEIIPGGTCGLAELDGRLVAVFSENRDDTDYNNDPTNFDLIAWYDPDSSAQWTFDHGTSSPFFGGATWLREIPDRSRLMVAVPEDVDGNNINIPPGTNGPDNDTDDSVPGFNRFNSTPRFLFSIARVALLADNAGMLIAGNNGYYRVDESDDSRDWNDDGDMTDIVLFRTNLSSGNSKYMSPAIEDFQGRGVIFVDLTDDNPEGAAFIVEESSQGTLGVDYNGDGDRNDTVIRYFEM